MMSTLMSWWPFCFPRTCDNDDENDPNKAFAAHDSSSEARFTPIMEDEDESNQAEWNTCIAKLLGKSYDDDDDDDDDDDAVVAAAATLIRRTEQNESWDCGIACLLMIFDWAVAQEGQAPSRQEILHEVATKSVWTVDLVWLLHKQIRQRKMPLRYLFSSRTLQVNASLLEFDYYKSSFRKDRDRVNAIFSRIQQEQLPVIQQDRLSMIRIISLIRQPKVIALALVDNSILLGRFRKSSQYTGHYILLLGISCDVSGLDSGHDVCLVVENPGKKAGYIGSRRLSLELFERAWRAPGTDEDIVFLVKDR